MSQNIVYLSSSSQVIPQSNPAYLRKEDIHTYDVIPYSTTTHLHSPTPEDLQNQEDTVSTKPDDISSNTTHPQSPTPEYENMAPEESLIKPNYNEEDDYI